jgi:hypothetical protein
MAGRGLSAGRGDPPVGHGIDGASSR